MLNRIRHKASKDVCKKVALDNLVPTRVVDEIIYQYYSMIANDIRNATLEDPDTFLNFNLPKLGKLYVSQKKLNKRKEKNDIRRSNEIV